jgi:hypothetical protein
MKRVLIEVPDNVDSSLIFYRDGDSFRYVNPKVVDEFPIQLNVTLSDEEIEKVNKHIKEAMRKSAIMPLAPEAPPSRKEFEALCTRVQRLELLTTSYQPSAEEGLKIVGCPDKDIEEIRSRVEKLERESERQCARVIKMQESISDDLK